QRDADDRPHHDPEPTYQVQRGGIALEGPESQAIATGPRRLDERVQIAVRPLAGFALRALLAARAERLAQIGDDERPLAIREHAWEVDDMPRGHRHAERRPTRGRRLAAH